MTGEVILGTFQELQKQGRTIVLITHEREVAEHAQRIVHIRDGRLEEDAGHVQQIINGGGAGRRCRGDVMSLRDLLAETFFSLNSNKVRSALTILGIVVGIASVILMVAIGQGSQQSIQQSIEQSGSNLLQVMPNFGGFGGGGQVRGQAGSQQTLTIADAERDRRRSRTWRRSPRRRTATSRSSRRPTTRTRAFWA